MANETHWHYRKCPECGAMILSRAQDAYNAPCVKCAKLHKRSQNPRHSFTDPDSLTVVYDPLPLWDGGFRRGACITRIQVECMCNVGTFTEGTILTDRENQKYKALTNDDGRQKLVPI